MQIETFIHSWSKLWLFISFSKNAVRHFLLITRLIITITPYFYLSLLERTTGQGEHLYTTKTANRCTLSTV